MFINNTFYNKSLYLWALVVLLVACQPDPVVVDEEQDDDEQLDPYQFRAPKHFPAPTYTFRNNPIDEKSFELGKKLFFDPNLSRDGSVSCNNCHQQALAFADSPQHPISVGIDDRLGERNAPSLVNMAFFKEFFWDGGVTHLDFTPLNAITAHFEMDNTMEVVIARLNNSEEYSRLFNEAFNREKITTPYVLHCLSQYMYMMISDRSKYDLYLQGKAEFNKEELAGEALFKMKCGHCHAGELQTDFSYRNNGLDSVFADLGRGRITEVTTDYGKFRVPSLRNVEITSPYMHNARFTTLEEVLDHYRTGILNSTTLDPSLKKGIDISDDEKDQIIAFLRTLTDRAFLNDSFFMQR